MLKSLTNLVTSYGDADGSLSRQSCGRSRFTEASKKRVISAACCQHVDRRAILSLHVVYDLEHDAAEVSHVRQQTDGKDYLTITMQIHDVSLPHAIH